jgi:hypothetical protein
MLHVTAMMHSAERDRERLNSIYEHRTCRKHRLSSNVSLPVPLNLKHPQTAHASQDQPRILRKGMERQEPVQRPCRREREEIDEGVLRAKTAAVLRGRVEGRSERDGERQQTEERGDSREHAGRMPMHHDVRGRQ